MNKFRILTGHIFLQKIKSKMFVISTIILLLISTIVVIWPKIQDEFLDNDERTEIYIINQSQQNIPNTLHSSTAIDYIQTKKPIKILQKQVKKGNKDGILLLKDGINGQLLIELQTYEELSTVEKQSIEQDVAGFNQLLTIKRANLTPKQVEDIFNSKIEIKETSLSPNVSSKSDEDKQIGAYLSYGVGFLIYIFILSYLSMITNDVAIEKSSRIMEVLISSVSPTVHLLSKISGILAAGIVQIVILITYSLCLLGIVGGDYVDIFKDIEGIVSISYFIFTFIFIILAYILYLAIGATLGSLVSKVEETSQALLPPIMLVMVGFMVMFYGLIDPNSTIVKVFSYIPFTSPMVMPMRISTTDIPIWQAVLSIILLVITILVVLIFNLRLYKGSVLIYSANSIMKKFKQAWSLTGK